MLSERGTEGSTARIFALWGVNWPAARRDFKNAAATALTSWRERVYSKGRLKRDICHKMIKTQTVVCKLT